MRTKGILIAGIVVVLVVFGFLILQGMQNSAAYYYTLAEVSSTDLAGKQLRVKGELVRESVVWEPEIPRLQFALTDGTHQLEMVYDAVIPDNFDHSTELIVEGRLAEDQRFKVSRLMLQCPSKYENASGKGGE